MTTSLATTQADAALQSLVTWAEQNFDSAVADGVKSIAATLQTALVEQRTRADQMFINAEQARAYAAELERQRDYMASQLMTAETAGRMTAQREAIEEIQRTLRVSRIEALSLFATLTGDNAHIIGDYYSREAANLARDIADTLRREARPLADTDTLPALPDDFDPDEDEDDL